METNRSTIFCKNIYVRVLELFKQANQLSKMNHEFCYMLSLPFFPPQFCHILHLATPFSKYFQLLPQFKNLKVSSSSFQTEERGLFGTSK